VLISLSVSVSAIAAHCSGVVGGGGPFGGLSEIRSETLGFLQREGVEGREREVSIGFPTFFDVSSSALRGGGIDRFGGISVGDGRQGTGGIHRVSDVFRRVFKCARRRCRLFIYLSLVKSHDM